MRNRGGSDAWWRTSQGECGRARESQAATAASSRRARCCCRGGRIAAAGRWSGARSVPDAGARSGSCGHDDNSPDDDTDHDGAQTNRVRSNSTQDDAETELHDLEACRNGPAQNRLETRAARKEAGGKGEAACGSQAEARLAKAASDEEARGPRDAGHSHTGCRPRSRHR